MKKTVVTENELTVETDVLEVLFDDDEPTEPAPLRHFHRVMKPRSLSAGPLANPRRTRLS